MSHIGAGVSYFSVTGVFVCEQIGRTIDRSATRSAKDMGNIETTFSTAKER